MNLGKTNQYISSTSAKYVGYIQKNKRKQIATSEAKVISLKTLAFMHKLCRQKAEHWKNIFKCQIYIS